MKLKYHFVTNEVADKIVAVAVGDDMTSFNGFIKMNDTGAFIFNMLQNDVTEDEIVAAMLENYDNTTEEEVRATVKDFIAELVKAEVVE